MPNSKILIIEDEKSISKLVRYNLEKSGFECITTITAEDGFEILDKEEVVLIILDIMLPKMDGLEACKILKQNKRFSHIPIILLTAKGEEVDKVVGFELGADDYVVKPFSPRELVLRVKAILKRKEPKEAQHAVQSAKNINLDPFKHKVTINNKKADLAPLEFKLLETLMSKRGRVLSREQLLDIVWGISADVTTRTVDTHIKRLRQKLGKSGKLIETIRSVGYRFSAEE